MSWSSGREDSDPRLLTALADLGESAYLQGRAVERGDLEAAQRHHGDSIIALDAALSIAQGINPEQPTSPEPGS